MADVGVFSRYKGFADFQDEARKTGLAEALTQAQITKALSDTQEVNAKKLGEEGFIRAAQGLPVTDDQKGAMILLNAKSGGLYADPVTGNWVQKPTLFNSIPLPGAAAPAQPIAQLTAKPAAPSKPNAGVSPGFEKYMTGPITPEKPAPAGAAGFIDEVQPTGNRKIDQSIAEENAKYTTPGAMFERENKLRDEFTNTTKSFRELQDAYSKMQRISDTAAGDIALLYATAKLNDPTSVVRESEFAVQASAGSLGDRWKNLVGKIQSGQRLTPSQRQQLKEEAGNLYAGQEEGYNRLKEQYKAIADRGKLNPDNIIVDYAAPKMPATPAEAKSQFNAKGQQTTPSGIKYRVVR